MTTMDVLGPAIGAGIFMLAMSLVREPSHARLRTTPAKPRERITRGRPHRQHGCLAAPFTSGPSERCGFVRVWAGVDLAAPHSRMVVGTFLSNRPSSIRQSVPAQQVSTDTTSQGRGAESHTFPPRSGSNAP
jgi:hypothetical protein